ncbi:MAG: DUF1353 domain-containing protein [Cyanobacteria bacterium SIG29]|nr:DUF1353 domain-containing protein [Cyanobacteria bacterium SIG29]
MKEQILSVSFDSIPDVRVRVIDKEDVDEIKKQKKKYPFELFNSIKVFIETSRRSFQFTIFNGYTWNGADIPRFFWRIIGSRTDNDFLVASMLHDYLLEFKKYILKEVLKGEISVKEYRRLTSLIFRHIIKEQGTNTIKANVMSWCVDVFQMFNKGAWKCF